jgi:hypothetical protein
MLCLPGGDDAWPIESTRVDYYFRQRVTEAELDLGFELLERADRNLAADIGVYCSRSPETA